ncbi:hypothetical protein [Streptomyces sp. NPDC059862]|uniref:hypothetical protein n=1 Tax=unclassified Streptomyces TaxID=2593676 RepID=UPI00363288AA
MMHCATPPLVNIAYRPCIRVMLADNSPQESFSSTWTWAAAIGLVTLLVTTSFSIDRVYKHRKAKEAKRLQSDYDLLDQTTVTLDKLAAMPAQKADLEKLSEHRSLIKQAEKRSPDLPFGAVVAHIDIYEKTVLPDGYARKLASRKIALDDLLELSRQQGAAITSIRTAIDAVQREIDRRTT